jgi:Sulfatase-modifying factor enzyme 1
MKIVLLLSGLIVVTLTAVAETNGDLLKEYTGKLDQLRTELIATIPKTPNEKQMAEFLTSDKLDAKLVKYVVLREATPQGLVEFAQQGKEQEQLINQLLADTELMKQMLVADGATAPKVSKRSKDQPAAQYGQAMKIYTDIQKVSAKAKSGVLQNLALAIALEYAVPQPQSNPQTATDAPKTVDPVKRYLSYEKAFLGGELDSEFDKLSAWELRFVVDGEEPDWMHDWGREMLRNYRPDHILKANPGWRYVRVVATNVKYGSSDEKFDRPELQNYQNIIMNGGICGRRAFFGRYILRCFGIPTIARPSKAHGALAHWTPNGWVINLGPGWGKGWTNTRYRSDREFLKTTQARRNPQAFLQVKRAQWIGDACGGAWGSVAQSTQEKIIAQSKAETLVALGENLAEADDEETTMAQKLMDAEVAEEKITVGANGTIVVPAALFNSRQSGAAGVSPMKSFAGGYQLYIAGFNRKGQTVLRGGGWRSGVECSSESRMRNSGLGNYENWGFRVAVTATGNNNPNELKLDCGNGVTLEMVYIKPDTFVMGGENEKETKYVCSNVPKHEVTLTKGYYLGKYEVTEAQFDAVCGGGVRNGPTHPRGFMTEGDTGWFCSRLSQKTGRDVRLPTEAEWEYAARAGSKTRWFFGNDPAPLAEYAVNSMEKNTGGMPVGSKKPNPWGLYDMYGNVWERVSDVYDRNYFANGPKMDPVGPIQPPTACTDYTINVPQAGKYELIARVVTVNYDQAMDVSANNDSTLYKIAFPYTSGKWQDTPPVVINLKQGTNTLKFSRSSSPRGIVVKSYTLKPQN